MGKHDMSGILILSVPSGAGRNGVWCKHKCSRELKKHRTILSDFNNAINKWLKLIRDVITLC